MTSSGPVAFELTASAAGYGQATIDGQDMTSQLAGFTLDVQAGELTTLVLRLKPGASGTVNGQALVQQTPQDMLEQLAGMLEALDPETLERQALESPDLDNEEYALTRELLRAAARSLRGA